ncbi:MAG: YgeY family selenium metabolism-linked hydrolase [Polyangiaceae bacterium]|nr:YgeY family selenium metabolism-linked hydrolase [Polyangiaceae bacterium]
MNAETTPDSVTDTATSKVKELAARDQDAVVQFLRDIVAIPSFSTQEEAVVKRIAQEMQKVGFDEVRLDAVGNVIGRIGNGPIKLMFDNHIDTVGIGDPKSWAGRNPFDPRLEDGKIWGRGVVDEKAAMASTVYAGKIVKELGLDKQCTIWVVGSAIQEDCDGLTQLHLIENEGVRPDFVVLGEPTDLNVYRGHRGRVEMTVSVRGRSAHAAHCEKGVSALYKAAHILLDIEKLNERLAHDEFLGKGTITASFMDVKTASLNSVPNAALIYLDRRLTVGETKESALQEILALPSLGDAEVEVLRFDAQAWTGKRVEQEKYFPTWVLDEQHVLVQAAVEAVEAARSTKPKVSRWVFSTNGVATMGRLGIPTIGFAPGLEELAHTTDEYIRVADLVDAVVGAALLPQALVRRLGK